MSYLTALGDTSFLVKVMLVIMSIDYIRFLFSRFGKCETDCTDVVLVQLDSCDNYPVDILDTVCLIIS